MRTRGPIPLPIFDDRIDAQARRVTRHHAWWPCRRGCDGCCRSLGELPHATAAEWKRAGAAMDALSPAARRAIAWRIEALASAPQEKPLVCPLLDRDTGACSIYAARPLACRTYGFYVSRGEGRWCSLIERELQARPDEAAAITFGNLDALDGEVAAHHGPTITLLAWWRRRRDVRAI